MGCSNSTHTRVGSNAPTATSPSGPQGTNTVVCTDNVDANGDCVDETEDAFLTLADASAFVEENLHIGAEKAEKLTRTLEQNEDGDISRQELEELNREIKRIKDDLEPKFKVFDHDNNGFVTREDATNILSEELCGLPHGSIVAMVQRYDHDNLNAVDFGAIVEFYALVKAKKSQLERKFEELDVDGSGDLVADELLQVMIKESSLEHFQVASIIDDFDLNKDGRIDKEEFMYMWTKLFE